MSTSRQEDAEKAWKRFDSCLRTLCTFDAFSWANRQNPVLERLRSVAEGDPSPRLLDSHSVAAAIAIVIGYLLGSVDFGVIVPRALGIDIYVEGSGNPGTSNVLRSVGKGPAAIVMVGDGLKGLIVAAIGSTMVDPTVGFAAALAAVLGHVFPVWHRFRGGRGVATAIGAAIWLAPGWGLALAVGWVVAVALTKTASIASLLAMAAYVPVMALAGHRGVRLLLSAAIALIVVLRHSGNISRLLSRSERTVDTA